MSKMKRFLLFVFDSYAGCGGWDDFWDSFASLDEAKEAATDLGYDIAQIADTETGEVHEGNLGAGDDGAVWREWTTEHSGPLGAATA